MPIFSFKCNECGKTLDKLMKLSDEAPQCEGHGQMQKTFTVPAFKFKNGQGTDAGNSMAIPGYPLPPV